MSINYSDSYTDLMLDFSLNYNKNQIVDFTDTTIHHSSNAYKRRIEGINGKNLQAINMINCKKRMNLATNNGNTWSDKTVLFGH